MSTIRSLAFAGAPHVSTSRLNHNLGVPGRGWKEGEEKEKLWLRL
jgi:hypothetical protein